MAECRDERTADMYVRDGSGKLVPDGTSAPKGQDPDTPPHPQPSGRHTVKSLDQITPPVIKIFGYFSRNQGDVIETGFFVQVGNEYFEVPCPFEIEKDTVLTPLQVNLLDLQFGRISPATLQTLETLLVQDATVKRIDRSQIALEETHEQMALFRGAVEGKLGK